MTIDVQPHMTQAAFCDFAREHAQKCAREGYSWIPSGTLAVYREKSIRDDAEGVVTQAFARQTDIARLPRFNTYNLDVSNAEHEAIFTALHWHRIRGQGVDFGDLVSRLTAYREQNNDPGHVHGLIIMTTVPCYIPKHWVTGSTRAGVMILHLGEERSRNGRQLNHMAVLGAARMLGLSFNCRQFPDVEGFKYYPDECLMAEASRTVVLCPKCTRFMREYCKETMRLAQA